MTLTVVDLFAGIGGISLGLERAGFTVAAQVEIDPFCRTVLNKHWPEVPKHDDVRTFAPWWGSSVPRPAVHLVAGGFPCQPVSQAGLQRAQTDPRWLWPEMAQAIEHLQPEWVLAENVPGLRTRGLSTGCSSWPTPLAKDGARGGLSPQARTHHARTGRTGLSLPEVLGGPSNPTWVEWLMGFPGGWTDVGHSTRQPHHRPARGGGVMSALLEHVLALREQRARP